MVVDYDYRTVSITVSLALTPPRQARVGRRRVFKYHVIYNRILMFDIDTPIVRNFYRRLEFDQRVTENMIRRPGR